MKAIEKNVELRANGRSVVAPTTPTLFGVTFCVRVHGMLHIVVRAGSEVGSVTMLDLFA